LQNSFVVSGQTDHIKAFVLSFVYVVYLATEMMFLFIIHGKKSFICGRAHTLLRCLVRGLSSALNPEGSFGADLAQACIIYSRNVMKWLLKLLFLRGELQLLKTVEKHVSCSSAHTIKWALSSLSLLFSGTLGGPCLSYWPLPYLTLCRKWVL
jgi:hypothetical protein